MSPRLLRLFSAVTVVPSWALAALATAPVARIVSRAEKKNPRGDTFSKSSFTPGRISRESDRSPFPRVRRRTIRRGPPNCAGEPTPILRAAASWPEDRPPLRRPGRSLPRQAGRPGTPHRGVSHVLSCTLWLLRRTVLAGGLWDTSFFLPSLSLSSITKASRDEREEAVCLAITSRRWI
jgi:hypothetical protein